MSLKKTGKCLLIGVLSICSTAIYAQSYGEKQSTITAGYGFPNLYKAILKTALENNSQNYYYDGGNSKQTVTGYGPLFLKYEYGLTKLIGIGAAFGYWHTKYTETYSYQSEQYDPNSGTYYVVSYKDVTKYDFSSFSAGVRLNFHFGTGEKLDPYAGVAAGYTNMRYHYTYESTNPDNVASPIDYTGIPVYFAMSAGLRYYFTKNIGAYAEVGIDKLSVIQGGLAIKF